MFSPMSCLLHRSAVRFLFWLVVTCWAVVPAAIAQTPPEQAIETVSGHQLGVVVLGALPLLMAVVFWNILLRRRIAAATRDLTEKNRQLASSHEALRQSEQKFRLIFENAPYAIVINRLEDGRFLDANQVFLQKNGISKQTLVEMTNREVHPWLGIDRKTVIDALKRDGTVRNAEITLKRADGTTAQVLYSSVVMDVDGERQILSMVVDVTEKIEAQNALRQSEEKFRTIFNNAPIGIYRTSYGGRLLEANDTLARMLGYHDRLDMLASVKNLSTDIYPAPGERRRLLDALVKSPKGVRIEIEFKRRDGSPFHAVVNASLQMDQNGRPAYLDGSIEDIADLKKAESELRRLAAAVEQSGEIIVITDPAGCIQYVNQSFERITGYSRGEAIGRSPRMLKSGEHDPAFYRDMWQTVSRGQVWNGRIVNRRKDGSRFTEDATISPVIDGAGQIVNYVAAKRDITHELAVENQYRQMQKMEAIGQLTGGVAHDFNNMLQAINGYMDLALLEIPADHDIRGFLEESRKAGHRAASLVQQLLLFSRRKIMQPVVVDLNRVIADLLKMIARLIGEHIQIQWQPSQAPCVIRADIGMLDQMVMNLCVNARDAMPNGGTLAITTRPVVIEADFCAKHAWARPGRFALLEVQDTGCGMDRQTCDRIFEPFFTTKAEGKGTGLGLSTVYGIVKQHGGMIDVASQPEAGTTFQVYFALCRQSETLAEVDLNVDMPGGTETLLLAEDDDGVRDLAGRILKRAGYAVIEARDGQEAVDIFRQTPDTIDLLLLDVVMPRLGGREAFESVRQIRSDVATVFFSGYDKGSLHTDFVLDDGVKLIQKPCTPRALLETVRAVLDDRPVKPN